MQSLAEDAAGWPAAAVEFFRRLAWTQNLHTPLLNRPRYHRVRAEETLGAIAISHRLTEATLLWLNPTFAPHPLIAGANLLLAGGRRAARPSISATSIVSNIFPAR